MRKDYLTGPCDPAMLSCFFDGELPTEASDKVRAHLDICPSCRQALEDQWIISENFQSAVVVERSRFEFDIFEKSLLQRLSTRPITLRNRILELITVKRFYIPATALATALILFFSSFYPASTTSSPSAIITSFSGDISSVMILETPKTHQTILWFNEDLPVNEKNHVL
jgi:hypothetical protein